jgi:hypothetical protein
MSGAQNTRAKRAKRNLFTAAAVAGDSRNEICEPSAPAAAESLKRKRVPAAQKPVADSANQRRTNTAELLALNCTLDDYASDYRRHALESELCLQRAAETLSLSVVDDLRALNEPHGGWPVDCTSGSKLDARKRVMDCADALIVVTERLWMEAAVGGACALVSGEDADERGFVAAPASPTSSSSLSSLESDVSARVARSLERQKLADIIAMLRLIKTLVAELNERKSMREPTLEAIAWEMRENFSRNFGLANYAAVAAVPAALEPHDLECPICANPFDAESRLYMTPLCCQQKQAICALCALNRAYEDSKSGREATFKCAFCREPQKLYGARDVSLSKSPLLDQRAPALVNVQ